MINDIKAAYLKSISVRWPDEQYAGNSSTSIDSEKAFVKVGPKLRCVMRFYSVLLA